MCIEGLTQQKSLRKGRETQGRDEKEKKGEKTVSFLLLGRYHFCERISKMLNPRWTFNQIIYKFQIVMELDKTLFIGSLQWEITHSWWLMTFTCSWPLKTFSSLESQRKLQLEFYCSINVPQVCFMQVEAVDFLGKKLVMILVEPPSRNHCRNWNSWQFISPCVPKIHAPSHIL